MSATPCPFCTLPKERIWMETSTAIAFLDGYPVAEGQTLVIPRHRKDMDVYGRTGCVRVPDQIRWLRGRTDPLRSRNSVIKV